MWIEYLIQQVYKQSRYLLTFVISLLLCLSFSQFADAASVSFSFSGIIGSVSGYDAEPHIGIGDNYSGTLSFDVNEASEVSNVGGDVEINGTLTGFTNYFGYGTVEPDSTSFWFNISPFGDGAIIGPSSNVVRMGFFLGSAAHPSGNLYDIITSGAPNIFGIDILAAIFNNGPPAYSVNHSSSVDGSFDVEISAVPLPAALPLYGAGIALIGLIGWRRSKKSAAIL